MKNLFLLSCCLFLLVGEKAFSQIIPILDTTFKAPTGPRYEKVIPSPNGNILVLGYYFPSTPFVDTIYYDNVELALLSPSGQYIKSMYLGATTGIDNYDVAVQPDGKIVLVNTSMDDSTITITRFNPDLSPDPTFHFDHPLQSGIDWPSQFALSESGEIIITGTFPSLPGAPKIIKLYPNGALNTQFSYVLHDNVTLDARWRQLIVLNDGKVLMNPVTTPGQPERLVVLKANGEQDTSGTFFSSVNPALMLKLRSGKVVAFDYDYSQVMSNLPSGFNTFNYIRFNPDGSIDNSFSSPEIPSEEIPLTFWWPTYLAEDEEGRILASGLQPSIFDGENYRILRLNTNGTLDTTFSIPAALGTDNYGYAANQPGRGLLLVKDHQLYRYGYNPNPPVFTGNILTNRIEGTIFRNRNNNCTMEPGETPLANRILLTQPGYHWSFTGADGHYSVLTDTGSYTTQQTINKYAPGIETQYCPGTMGVIVNFGAQQNITSANHNFANNILESPFLNVTVSSNRRRRCFKNNTRILVNNYGTTASPQNATVHLRMPAYVHLISASKPFTYHAADSSYRFALDTLRAGYRTTIDIVDSVACIVGLMGVEQCTKAWITPGNISTPNPANWDGVDLTVSSSCHNGKPRFKIENTGNAMQAGRMYTIYIDSLLAYSNMFQLAANNIMYITVPQALPHQTARLEVSQSAHHPTSTFSASSISCGTGISTPGGGYFAQPDESPVESISCMPIRDSYDPNDKTAYPAGSTAAGNVLPNRPFKYKIRFQNKGNDTAFSVVVVDTLDAGFNPATLEMGICSHPYQLKVTGSHRPVLTWYFEGINLADSTTNEPASHGYIDFTIRPYDTLALGTRLQNFADIYFDFNPAVRTNTTINTLFVPTLTSGLIDTIEVFTPVASFISPTDIRIYPNPNQGKFEVVGYSDFSVTVFSLTGKQLLTQPTDKRHRLDLSRFGAGIYLVETNGANGKRVQKVVVE